ncbi:VMAP-C domain-containing protein [Dactylosporangium cerinum]
MFQLEPDPLERDRYVLTHWRQLDERGWYPRQHDERIVSLGDVERHVEDLILAAEAEWADFTGPIGIEFILPRALLSLPIDRWVKESDSTWPSQLALDYPITVRSLERMRNTHWHRMWRRRWKALIECDDNDSGALWVEGGDEKNLIRLEASLKGDDRFWSLVLPTQPEARTMGEVDEVEIALRAGLPVLIWPRERAMGDGFKTAVRDMLNGGDPVELPSRTQKLRNLATQSDPMTVDGHVGHFITVLWDDPSRLVVSGGPVVAPRL